MAKGDWVMRCEARTLDDIRALGGNTVEEERMFEAAARISEVNLAMYRTFAQPVVKALVTPEVAQGLKALHPLRMQYDLFGPENPFLGWVGAAAEKARADRQPVSAENPFLPCRRRSPMRWSMGWRATARRWNGCPRIPSARIYGNEGLAESPWRRHNLQPRARRAAKSLLHRELTEQRIAAYAPLWARAGCVKRGIRALIYVGQPRGVVDERGFEAIRRLRRNDSTLSLHEFKAIVRQQFLMLVIDEEAAMAALPDLLPPDEAPRLEALEMLRSVLAAAGPLDGESARRMERVTAIFTPLQPPAITRAVASAKTA